MSFAYPWVLLALLLPAALLVWVWTPKGRRVVLPFDHGWPAPPKGRSLRRGTRGGGRFWFALVGVAESLPPLLLAVAIVLLAGPQRLGLPENKRSLTNIELCVDISGSMGFPLPGGGIPYDISMKAIDKFLDYRKGDAFGLTFFGDNYLHWCPLTSDVSAVRCAPPLMNPNTVPSWFGGTAIAKALQACRKVLVQREEGDRMIILVTDGSSADFARGVDAEIIKQFRQDGITVFAILIGSVRPDDEVYNIVHATGGEAFQAGDQEALDVIFRQIDRMKQARLEKSVGETKDDFFLWCVIGLSVLGAASLSAFGVRYVPW